MSGIPHMPRGRYNRSEADLRRSQQLCRLRRRTVISYADISRHEPRSIIVPAPFGIEREKSTWPKFLLAFQDGKNAPVVTHDLGTNLKGFASVLEVSTQEPLNSVGRVWRIDEHRDFKNTFLRQYMINPGETRADGSEVDQCWPFFVKNGGIVTGSLADGHRRGQHVPGNKIYRISFSCGIEDEEHKNGFPLFQLPIEITRMVLSHVPVKMAVEYLPFVSNSVYRLLRKGINWQELWITNDWSVQEAVRVSIIARKSLTSLRFQISDQEGTRSRNWWQFFATPFVWKSLKSLYFAPTSELSSPFRRYTEYAPLSMYWALKDGKYANLKELALLGSETVLSWGHMEQLTFPNLTKFAVVLQERAANPNLHVVDPQKISWFLQLETICLVLSVTAVFDEFATSPFMHSLGSGLLTNLKELCLVTPTEVIDRWNFADWENLRNFQHPTLERLYLQGIAGPFEGEWLFKRFPKVEKLRLGSSMTPCEIKWENVSESHIGQIKQLTCYAHDELPCFPNLEVFVGDNFISGETFEKSPKLRKLKVPLTSKLPNEAHAGNLTWAFLHAPSNESTFEFVHFLEEEHHLPTMESLEYISLYVKDITSLNEVINLTSWHCPILKYLTVRWRSFPEDQEHLLTPILNGLQKTKQVWPNWRHTRGKIQFWRSTVVPPTIDADDEDVMSFFGMSGKNVD